jgi:hypothetical protein
MLIIPGIRFLRCPALRQGWRIGELNPEPSCDLLG